MRIGLVALVCAALALAGSGSSAGPAASAGAAPATYALTDLGQPGDETSSAVALNDEGAVLLNVTPAGGGLGTALWRDGARTGIGVPSGYASFFSAAIDAAGAVAGTAYDVQGLGRPFLWRDGQWTDLGLPPGHVEFAMTHRSDAGHIVGTAHVAPGQVGPRGFLWHADTGWVDLGAGALPAAVDAAGRVAGSVPGAGGDTRAAVWRMGEGWADLGVLAGPWSVAHALNGAGQVVGASTYGANPFSGRAFLWQGGQMLDLGTLPELDSSVALALNDAGRVVGAAYQSGRGEQPYRAFLWRDGAMADLNDLLPSGSGWTLEYATGVNARGQIAGIGKYLGQQRAFLLTPVVLPPGPCDAPFADVPADHPACQAIAALSSQGTIRGYATTPPTFGPADPVQRAQIAAFLVRALRWQDRPQDPNTFSDFGQLVGELREASLILANACADPANDATCVARGYGDGRFGPTDQVTYAQVISFVARAFRLDADYDWQPQMGAHPYSGVPAAHESDVRAYHFYTEAAGGIPDAPTGDGWNEIAPREWVAMVLYRALQSAP